MPTLKSSVDLKVNIFLKLLSIANHRNTDIAISTLYLCLEAEISYAKLDGKMAKQSGLFFAEKLLTALNNATFLVSLHKSIANLLPEAHNKLSGCISHLCLREKATRSTGGKKGRYFSTFKYSFEGLRDEVQSICKKLGPHFSIDGSKPNIDWKPRTRNYPAEKISGWDDLVSKTWIQRNIDVPSGAVIDELTSTQTDLYHAISEQNQLNQIFMKTPTNNESELTIGSYKNVLNNVEFFYRIAPLHHKTVKLINDTLASFDVSYR